MKYKMNKKLSPQENIALELNNIANELASQNGHEEDEGYELPEAESEPQKPKDARLDVETKFEVDMDLDVEKKSKREKETAEKDLLF